MTAIEQADALQEQAITVLLAERQQIDDRLTQLGHGEGKKRGRPRKTEKEKPPLNNEGL